MADGSEAVFKLKNYNLLSLGLDSAAGENQGAGGDIAKEDAGASNIKLIL